MKSIKLRLVASALSLSCASALWSWFSRPSAAVAAPSALGVGARAALVVRAEGRVAAMPNAEAVVTVESSGQVSKLLAEEGQSVEQGAVLAELDSGLEIAALAEARARTQELESELKWLKVERGRSEVLVQTGALSRVTLEGAVQRMDLTKLRLATGIAAVRRMELAVQRRRLLAPIAGRIVSRTVRLGETPEPGRVLFTIVDLSKLRVEAEVDEFDIAQVKLGSLVKMSAEGFPQRVWRGRVSEIPATLASRRLRPSEPARDSDGRVLAVKVEPSEPMALLMGQRLELDIDVLAAQNEGPSTP